ncbi:UPF0236 family protein [Lachnospiraceae bacterium ZAX-1]
MGCIYICREKAGQWGRELKASTAYEGWNEKNELVGKVTSAGFEAGKTFQKLREAMIRKVYNTDEAKLRVMNGDGAEWVKGYEDMETVFQLDRFHVYQKILQCIEDKEMQKEFRELYDKCEVDKLLEEIQMYADSVDTDIKTDKRENNALELLGYLKSNKDAKMSFSRKAFLGIFKNKDFSQLIYR